MARGVGGGSPANVAKYLKGMDFPAKKDDLISHAKKNEADDTVIDTITKMPDKEYGDMSEVMKGYGEKH